MIYVDIKIKLKVNFLDKSLNSEKNKENGSFRYIKSLSNHPPGKKYSINVNHLLNMEDTNVI